MRAATCIIAPRLRLERANESSKGVLAYVIISRQLVEIQIGHAFAIKSYAELLTTICRNSRRIRE